LKAAAAAQEVRELLQYFDEKPPDVAGAIAAVADDAVFGTPCRCGPADAHEFI